MCLLIANSFVFEDSLSPLATQARFYFWIILERKVLGSAEGRGAINLLRYDEMSVVSKLRCMGVSKECGARVLKGKKMCCIGA